MTNPTISAEEPDTYPQPEDGWVCFHCGERFKKFGAAEDHFGARPGDGLACKIKAGDERGLVMDLRKAQKRTHELQGKIDSGGCTLAGPKRGDCSHFIGLPGHAMPGQHDGPDDTVDHYEKPNGWCWACWRVEQIRQAEQAAYERAAQFIADKAKLYPTHIFLEPKRGEHGKTVDGCSAAALRTMAPIWAEEVSALAQQPEEVE